MLGLLHRSAMGTLLSAGAIAGALLVPTSLKAEPPLRKSVRQRNCPTVKIHNMEREQDLHPWRAAAHPVQGADAMIRNLRPFRDRMHPY